jgi:biopolymer transport protein TolR
MPKLEPMSNGSVRGSSRRGRGARVSTSLAEINVVPLVDVMLVLLVIFMVATPMMQQGIPVKLPESRTSKATNAPVTVTVPSSFRTDRRVQIGKDFVRLSALAERVKQALEGRSQQTVMLAGDASVTLQEVSAVLDVLKEGGVTQVNIQTQPAVSRERNQ